MNKSKKAEFFMRVLHHYCKKELTVHRTIWTAVLLVLSTNFEFIKIIKKRKKSIFFFYLVY